MPNPYGWYRGRLPPPIRFPKGDLGMSYTDAYNLALEVAARRVFAAQAIESLESAKRYLANISQMYLKRKEYEWAVETNRVLKEFAEQVKITGGVSAATAAQRGLGREVTEYVRRQNIAAYERAYDFSTGIATFYLTATSSDVVRTLKEMERTDTRLSIANAMTRAARRVVVEFPEIASKVVDEATSGLDDRAFPREFILDFKLKLMGLVSTAEVQPTGGRYVTINLQFNRLGNEADLTKAYHYGALVAGQELAESPILIYQKRVKAGTYTPFKNDVKRVHLPWTKSQQLRTKDDTQRYKFWRFIAGGSAQGRDELGRFKYNSIFRRAWQDTVDARLKQFASSGGYKAPQWLLLEYGQPAYAPRIPVYKEAVGKGWERGATPGGITGRFMKLAGQAFERATQEELEATMALLTNEGRTIKIAEPLPSYTRKFTNIQGQVVSGEEAEASLARARAWGDYYQKLFGSGSNPNPLNYGPNINELTQDTRVFYGPPAPWRKPYDPIA